MDMKRVRLLFIFWLISSLAHATALRSPPPVSATLPPYPPGLSVVSKRTAEDLFHELATDPEIPWDYPDGCYAKAEMADIFLEQKGIIAGKAFAEGEIYHQSHWGESFWLFHVASLILVEYSGRAQPYIIDPFLSDKLVSYKNWLALVKKDPNTIISQTYFTNRFVYGPQQRNLNLNHYNKHTLKDMKTVLQQIRDYLAGYSGRLLKP